MGIRQSRYWHKVEAGGRLVVRCSCESEPAGGISTALCLFSRKLHCSGVPTYKLNNIFQLNSALQCNYLASAQCNYLPSVQCTYLSIALCISLPRRCSAVCAGCVTGENTRQPEFSGKTLVHCSLYAQDGDDDKASCNSLEVVFFGIFCIS